VFSWTRQTQAEFLETLAPAAIVVLLLVLLGLNAAAVLLRNKYEQRW
jgi:phosphate transport system permease protein